MDSLTQLTLGSAVAVAAMGNRTTVWKAALWGAVCGTLPDLDAFIDHGDPISNMTLHRAESHALSYLTLASPLIAWLPARIHGESYWRWWLAVWLALVTHPLLDLMTIYGTQIARPFTDYPFGVGSIFIIDPLYTLPLLIGVIAALALRNARGLRWNAVGLALATVYLAWSFGAQQYVERLARESLRAQGIAHDRLLAGATPFNTLLWRVLVVTPEHYYEGFYSLLDDERRVHFNSYPRGEELYRQLNGIEAVQRMAWFSHGFFRMREDSGSAMLSDLRMGLEPFYTFTFRVAERTNPRWKAVEPEAIETEPDVGAILRWLWQRLKGESVASFGAKGN